MASIGDLFKIFQKGFFKNALEGAGLALATSGASMLVINKMIGTFRSSTDGIPQAFIQLMGLSGFDVFFSLILGAIVARNYADTTKIFLKKK